MKIEYIVYLLWVMSLLGTFFCAVCSVLFMLTAIIFITTKIKKKNPSKAKKFIWISIALIGLFVIIFLLGEFLFPH